MKAMNWTTGLTAMALLWAANASALSYCDASNPCKLATDTCLGSVCVPQAKLCKSTASCSTWQVCDFTCPGSANTTTTDPMPGGGSSGSADASSGAVPPMPAMDAGSGIAMPPDAGEMPMPLDGGTMDATPYTPPNCPKDVGVCVVDPTKVATMPGCLDFCTGLTACNLASGGSSTGSGGAPIPPPGPGGSGDSNTPGFAPVPAACDGCSSDKMIPAPTDAGSTDSGPIGDTTSGSGDLQQCVTMCSVLVLENIAHKELVAAEQCVAAYPTACSDMQSQCQSKIQDLGTAMMVDDSWTLGLFPGIGGGPVVVPANPDGGSTGSADAGSTSGSTDGGSVFGDALTTIDAAFGGDGGGPKGTDGATGGSTADAGSNSNGADGGLKNDSSTPIDLQPSASSSAASACTAGRTTPAAPWGLAGLGLLCLAALGLRRRTVSAR